MNNHLDSRSFTLDPADNQRLANVCGQFNEHLRLIEQRLGVEVNSFTVIGDSGPVQAAERVLTHLYASADQGQIDTERVHLLLQEAQEAGWDEAAEAAEDLNVSITTRHGLIRGRGKNQRRYLDNVLTQTFYALRPQSTANQTNCDQLGGNGKTYLAVACAVEALEKQSVRRILLVRPAVEAGERLGFLPGDLAQKVDPYLRPLYDALYEMLGFERVDKLIERNVIEVAPLAYMRGRTLNESFIILDEAQNTTVEQMKMFLTRIGFGSTAVVTGDVTQVDLPKNTRSGLRHVIEVLKDVEGVSFTFFQAKDVVRHPLVQKVVTAYEEYEKHEASRSASSSSTQAGS